MLGGRWGFEIYQRGSIKVWFSRDESHFSLNIHKTRFDQLKLNFYEEKRHEMV